MSVPKQVLPQALLLSVLAELDILTPKKKLIPVEKCWKDWQNGYRILKEKYPELVLQGEEDFIREIFLMLQKNRKKS